MTVKPEIVYPSPWTLVGVAVTGTLFTAILAGLVLALPSFGPFGAVLVGILALIVIALYAREVFFTLRELVKRRPLFRLDADGVESAAGRVWWSDVAHIDLVGYEKRGEDGLYLEEWLSLSLRPRTEPVPPTLRYVSEPVNDRVPRRVGASLEVPVWRRRRRVLESTRAFYNGPLSADLESRATYLSTCVFCGRKPRPDETPSEEWRVDAGTQNVYCPSCWEQYVIWTPEGYGDEQGS